MLDVLQQFGQFHDGKRVLKLPKQLVFVFGSNLKGIHGAGAAKDAKIHFGALWGVPEGRQGQSYALPTCTEPGLGLDLDAILYHIDRFRDYVLSCPDVGFYVTAVGCGFAHYTAEQIAPMFRGIPRCVFPESWKEYLLPEKMFSEDEIDAHIAEIDRAVEEQDAGESGDDQDRDPGQ